MFYVLLHLFSACRAHIIVATPGRFVDMLKRKDEGCPLAGALRSLVIIYSRRIILIQCDCVTKQFQMCEHIFFEDICRIVINIYHFGTTSTQQPY